MAPCGFMVISSAESDPSLHVSSCHNRENISLTHITRGKVDTKPSLWDSVLLYACDKISLRILGVMTGHQRWAFIQSSVVHPSHELQVNEDQRSLSSDCAFAAVRPESLYDFWWRGNMSQCTHNVTIRDGFCLHPVLGHNPVFQILLTGKQKGRFWLLKLCLPLVLDFY